MGYIVIRIREKEGEKLTINNEFTYMFLISRQSRKIAVEKLFSLLIQYGELTSIEEVKQLSFKSIKN